MACATISRRLSLPVRPAGEAARQPNERDNSSTRPDCLESGRPPGAGSTFPGVLEWLGLRLRCKAGRFCRKWLRLSGRLAAPPPPHPLAPPCSLLALRWDAGHPWPGRCRPRLVGGPPAPARAPHCIRSACSRPPSSSRSGPRGSLTCHELPPSFKASDRSALWSLDHHLHLVPIASGFICTSF